MGPMILEKWKIVAAMLGMVMGFGGVIWVFERAVGFCQNGSSIDG